MNLGIVGTGAISSWMTEAAKKVPEATMYSVYSRSEKKGIEFADANGIGKVYTDYGQFLSDNGMDAVYIASPNFAHCGQAIEAMQAGKHVLCEKPIASNTVQYNAMKAAAIKNQVVLMEAMRPAHDPLIIEIKKNLKKIGDIRRVNFEYCQYSSRYDKFKKGEVLNAFNPELSNAAIMDIGVYCIHVFAQLFGKPDSIKSYSLKFDNGMEGHGSVILQYDNMVGEIAYSKIIDSVNPSIIQGENGTMVIDKIATPSDIKIIYRNGETEYIAKGDLNKELSPKDNMHYELKDFVRYINNGNIENEHSIYSEMTMEIIDEVRRQNNIVFPDDKQQDN